MQLALFTEPLDLINNPESRPAPKGLLARQGKAFGRAGQSRERQGRTFDRAGVLVGQGKEGQARTVGRA